MNNKLITQTCPHCGMSTVTLDPSFNSAAPVKISGRVGYFALKLRCTSCDWRGDEIWQTYYSRVVTTFTPTPKVVEPTVPMFDVVSSVIKSIGYDRKSEVLYVKFNDNDKVYGYEDVPWAIAMDFLNAESPGRFYGEYIRGRYNRVK